MSGRCDEPGRPGDGIARADCHRATGGTRRGGSGHRCSNRSGGREGCTHGCRSRKGRRRSGGCAGTLLAVETQRAYKAAEAKKRESMAAAYQGAIAELKVPLANVIAELDRVTRQTDLMSAANEKQERKVVRVEEAVHLLRRLLVRLTALPQMGLVGSGATSSGNAMGSSASAGPVGAAVAATMAHPMVTPFKPPLVVPRAGAPAETGVNFMLRIVRHIVLAPGGQGAPQDDDSASGSSRSNSSGPTEVCSEPTAQGAGDVDTGDMVPPVEVVMAAEPSPCAGGPGGLGHTAGSEGGAGEAPDGAAGPTAPPMGEEQLDHGLMRRYMRQIGPAVFGKFMTVAQEVFIEEAARVAAANFVARGTFVINNGSTTPVATSPFATVITPTDVMNAAIAQGMGAQVLAATQAAAVEIAAMAPPVAATAPTVADGLPDGAGDAAPHTAAGAEATAAAGAEGAAAELSTEAAAAAARADVLRVALNQARNDTAAKEAAAGKCPRNTE